MDWIRSLYIAASIFGVGVTVADLVGAFSSLTEGGSDDGAGQGAGQGDGNSDGASIGDEFDVDVSADTGEGAGQGDGDGDAHPSVLAHDLRRGPGVALRLMTALRSIVYFAVGFGPVGWFATTQYARPIASLAWSVPVGIGVMVSARILRRLFRKDLSSDIKPTDLLMETGTVTVSIGAGAMGKARVIVGGVYVDRFARAHDPGEEIGVGARIRVVDVTDECVFVEVE
jgi:hypothetical protein